MTPVDLVYILGTGSCWNNNELRISLRSVQKNLVGFGRIFVVGENPGFLSQKVTFIPYPDEFSSKNADGNMTRKILRACQIPELSNDFLFMNDDFIINKEVYAPDIPWLHKGDMKDRPAKYWETQLYRFRLRRTFEVLAQRGLPTLQYDYHAPMLMNKKLFPEAMAQFDYADDIGYTFRSLYGNYYNLPAVHLEGQKVTLYQYCKVSEIEKRVESASFVGYNDSGLNNSLKYWMLLNFGKQSEFESNNNFDDRVADIAQWDSNGRDYDLGVKIYNRWFHTSNLSRILANNHTQSLETKLNFKLTQYLLDL